MVYARHINTKKKKKQNTQNLKKKYHESIKSTVSLHTQPPSIYMQ